MAELDLFLIVGIPSQAQSVGLSIWLEYFKQLGQDAFSLQANTGDHATTSREVCHELFKHRQNVLLQDLQFVSWLERFSD